MSGTRALRKEPIVWIIDSEQWPKACLRAELIERGYELVALFRSGMRFAPYLGGPLKSRRRS